MTKLYYTDPLKAAFMAREYGVELTAEDATPLFLEPVGTHGFKWCIRDDAPFDIRFGGDKFYLHPDSIHIFEPQDRDRVQGWDGNHNHYIYYKGEHTPFECEGCFVNEIIQRNGEHFFMPESEEV